MSAVIRSELRKVLTTRLWWILLILMAGTIAFFAGVFAFAFAFGDTGAGVDGEPVAIDPTSMAITVYTLGVSLGYAFPMTFGALTVTGEFRHRTFATTLALQPSRLRFVLGKAVAALPFALLYGAVSAASAVAVGVAALSLADQPTLLDDASVWRSIGLSVVAMSAWMLVGVGFGTAVPNQVAVIVILLGWTQLVEPILRVALGFLEPVSGLAKFLPGAAGEALVGNSFYAASGLSDLLAPWAGLVVLLGYGVVAAVIGWLTTLRRDLT